MCPICLGAAALATMAGAGSAGGLTALAAVKLGIKRKSENARLARKASPKFKLQPHQSGGGK